MSEFVNHLYMMPTINSWLRNRLFGLLLLLLGSKFSSKISLVRELCTNKLVVVVVAILLSS